MNKHGFTFIEVLVVSSVIGLMGALASVMVVKGMEKSRIRQATVELNMISTGVLQLAWDTGKWPNRRFRTNPGSVEVWNISKDSAGIMGSDGSYTDWRGPYYGESILDPWGNPYFFDPDFRIAGVNRIVVGSFGPNGRGRNQYDSDDIVVRLDD
ncbi:MAG: prepilin-type N-terminal cleavage/methylation domain-containing protein [Kiritimatiellales bacterium]|nr:prepilin-type N-terminal cleavage/methylation domain-containing protein [Kiritimatiellales bacterium]